MSRKCTSLVIGDVTIDWNLARGQMSQRTGALWDPGFISRCYRQDGGAALLGELIDKGAGTLGQTVHRVRLRKAVVPGSAGFAHSYTLCGQYPRQVGEKDLAWRIKEFLGVDTPSIGVGNPATTILTGDDGKADLIVIDDANQGFRRSPKSTWPASLQNPKDTAWVLLKLADPDFADMNLLEHLKEKFPGRILLVLTVNDLRALNIRISRELSWERTIRDLIIGFRNLRDLQDIGKCVVSFYAEGAVVLPSPNSDDDALLYYDPHSIEGTWGVHYPGKMAGYTQLLTAGIALGFICSGNFDDLGPGILGGLEGSRLLHQRGFTVKEELPIPKKLYFPAADLAETLARRVIDWTGIDEESDFSAQIIPTNQKPQWTILQLRYPDAERVVQLAIEIVESGPEKAMRHIPVARFGDFISLERTEIEGMRQISALIKEYRKSANLERPLSIAVFGAPGSGKSFAISEIAKSLSPESATEIKQFNLSQFASPAELLGAFHQIRDAALKGQIPLVFWDEFDSTLGDHSLGWIRYFLAPMQDGTFQHGELTHPIGRSIFVFAGGTSHTLEQFEAQAGKDPQAKGPDFLSRLKGYADIGGLDHDKDRFNPNVVIRRALLLRSTLLKAAQDIVHREGALERLRVDSGVLNAFLFLREYKHGVRSLESVVRMSFLSGKASFDRSSLPSESQMELHVDSDQFMELVTNEQLGSSELKWD
jgi:hypothetical protein